MTTEDLQDTYNYRYVTYDVDGKRIRVNCRKCNDIIADVMDIGIIRDPVTGIMAPRQRFMSLTNYTTVLLELSDKSQMSSATCKKCAKHLSARELDLILRSEIQAIEYDAEVHGQSEMMAPVIDALLNLTVVRRIN